MTIHVSVEDASARLSELLEKVQAGEDVVIARGGDPIVKLTRIERKRDPEQIEKAIAAINAFRARQRSATTEEIIEWRDEGRRF